MSTTPSASKAALLAACAYSFRPGTPTVASKGKAAEMGDEFHRLIAPIVETMNGEIPPDATLWMRRRMVQATAWVAKNHEAGWRAEEAYAYEPDHGAARVLGHDIHREYEKYGKLPFEIGGSADIALVRKDEVVVFDWKTGRTIGAGCEEQLGWLALFAAKAHRKQAARAVALHVTDRGVEETEWHYDDVGLWRIAEQLRIDVRAIEDAWPTPGSHCENCYCEARDTCEPYIQLRHKEAS